METAFGYGTVVFKVCEDRQQQKRTLPKVKTKIHCLPSFQDSLGGLCLLSSLQKTQHFHQKCSVSAPQDTVTDDLCILDWLVELHAPTHHIIKVLKSRAAEVKNMLQALSIVQAE